MWAAGERGGDAQLLALRRCGLCWAGLSARAGWDWAAVLGFAGRGGKRSWAGLVSDFLSSFPILFLFQIKFKLFEFKLEFEFNPSTQTSKTMHQHECNNKIIPMISFNY